MRAEELVQEWPKRWPRPTIGSTKNAVSQIKPFGRDFAGRDVATITREEFRRWALDNKGRARYVRTMLYDALDAGIVEENVAAGLRIPKPRPREVKWPTLEEVDALAWAAPTPLFATMIYGAAFTGLRLGEQRGLRAADLRFEPGTDTPVRAVVSGQINREGSRVAAKTAASEASLAILPRGRNAVHEALGMPRIRDRIWGFTRAQHQAYWDRTRETAEINVKWHSLRHFCATYLLDRGASVDDVALQLRCSVQEIRTRYGHPDRDAALDRLAELAS